MIASHPNSPPPLRIPCSEQKRLLMLYSDATHHLADLVKVLSEVAGSHKVAYFNRAWEDCESARHHCADIRKLIYSHVAEHRCALVLPGFGARRI